MRKTFAIEPARASLPLRQWPEADRTAWLSVSGPRQGPFRREGASGRLSEATLGIYAKGLRQWLGFLKFDGQLDARELPYERATEERTADYFGHQLAHGISNRTVLHRFIALRCALQLMYPKMDFTWITKPQGVPLERILPVQARQYFLPSSQEALAWAQDLFNEGITIEYSVSRCVQVREAVIIAIFATRAPRLGAMASLRLGRHVKRSGGGWVLDQEAAITKTRTSIEAPLSPEVAAMLERYVTVERVELLMGDTHDALWVSAGGGPQTVLTLAERFRRRAIDRFGVGFGPHRLRKSLTTVAAMENPNFPLDAPLILGHSPAVSLAHYNRATAVRASRRHQERLRDLRADTRYHVRRKREDDWP